MSFYTPKQSFGHTVDWPVKVKELPIIVLPDIDHIESINFIKKYNHPKLPT